METVKIIAGSILMVIGVLFFLNNKNIAKGAYKFYQWMYTEKRLRIMFRVVSIVLIIGGLLVLILE